MVFNATFNNISVISWRSILLVEETRVSWENHRPVASLWQTSLSHNVVSSTPRLSGVRTHNFSGDSHWWQRMVYTNLYMTATFFQDFGSNYYFSLWKRDATHLLQWPTKHFEVQSKILYTGPHVQFITYTGGCLLYYNNACHWWNGK